MAQQPEITKIRNKKGFTLVELAIVLVIVGMLVGVGSGMMGMLTTAIKVREAKELQDASVQSVISWASANNSIPNAAGFPTAAKTPQDAWGRDFIYLYEARLNTPTPTKDTICGRRSTDLTLQTTDPAATISNVAFVVISSSDDAAVQTTLTATAAPAVAATYNTAAYGPAIALAARGSATGTIVIDANNTDIIRWVTLDELRSKVGCQGAPMKIMNNELPYGYNGIAYSATVFADGGVHFTGGTGTYRWCMQNSGGVCR
jgi:prepilin-type N-terminal cleavage/methylation domain-containing protein